MYVQTQPTIVCADHCMSVTPTKRVGLQIMTRLLKLLNIFYMNSSPFAHVRNSPTPFAHPFGVQTTFT